MSEYHTIPRVLLVGPALTGGGAEMRFNHLAEHLLGGRADVLTLLGSARTTLSKDGRVTGSLGWKSEISYPRVALALRRQIKNSKYDLVAGFGHFPNLLAWWATRGLTSQPRLLFFECTRLEALMRLQTRPKDVLVTYLLRQAYRRANAVAANSIDGAEECIRFLGVDRHRTARVPNLINAVTLTAQAQEPPCLDWPGNVHTIVVSSRLHKLKRVDTVIRAVAALSSAPDWQLIIVGDGPEKKDLERLVMELQLTERIRFCGWVENPLPLIARATAFVLSSEYEGFSNAILEAMFLDVPVITSYCSSDARKMCGKGAALGFEPGDASALTVALSRALASSKLRSELIHNAAAYRSCHELLTSVNLYERLLLAVANDTKLPAELATFGLDWPALNTAT